MLIDDVTIDVAAGNGGNGQVAFNKNLKELGPTGATGGNGGSVFCVGTADIGALAHFRHTKKAHAGNGKIGGFQYRDGEDGPDKEFLVPVGTVIHNLDNGSEAEVTAIGQRLLLAKGGRGGKGNYHFRSATNTSPKESQPGSPGQHYRIRLELKLIADVGLIGLPNAGKSSLINELTHTQQKVANPFTTLHPGLGAYYELILADIPGLIEGASSGKGLGMQFLRHVERTRVLFHLISAESDDPVRDVQLIRTELGQYNPALLKKDEHVFLSKTDLVDATVVAEHLKALKKAKITATPISIHDSDSLEKVHALLRTIIAAKKVVPAEDPLSHSVPPASDTDASA